MAPPKRKGIILAGGAGTRLHPATLAVSKQLLPVFDKPMIYYPLTTLMLAGIREILVISDAAGHAALRAAAGRWLAVGGSSFPTLYSQARTGCSGLHHRRVLHRGRPVGPRAWRQHLLRPRLPQTAGSATARDAGASVFAYHVHDPERYGVAEFDTAGKVISLSAEAEAAPKANYVTGLYFYDRQVVELAKALKPAARRTGNHRPQPLLSGAGQPRSRSWDAATPGSTPARTKSMLEASQFIATLEKRQGLKVACPEEIAFRRKWIDAGQLEKLAAPLSKNGYGQYLQRLLREQASG